MRTSQGPHLYCGPRIPGNISKKDNLNTATSDDRVTADLSPSPGISTKSRRVTDAVMSDTLYGGY